VILAGIDEAGYGPRLGPLVVTANAFRSQSAEPPRLWPQCLFLDGEGAVKVGDSKALYAGGRGFVVLERAVLSFAALAGGPPATVGEFLRRWSAEGAEETLSRPWYDTARMPLPAECAAGEIAAGAAFVTDCLAREGLEYAGTWQAVVDEVRYNEICERVCNKAVLLFGRNSILMRILWERFGLEGVYLTVDRHGGRKFYAGLLDVAFPEVEINVLGEAEDLSVYRLSGRDGRRLDVRFMVRAEAADSAAALSSMWAKYTREILMRAFNAYWLARADGLARTAGYWVDAERFLADLLAAGVVTEAEMRLFTRSR
jgi:ribonuclease HII